MSRIKKRVKRGMYWWIRDSANMDQPPRVYQLAYQPEVHKKAEQVIDEQKKEASTSGEKPELVHPVLDRV